MCRARRSPAARRRAASTATRCPSFDVYRTAAGFYVATYCHCGPCTRESGDERTRELAQAAFDSGAYGR